MSADRASSARRDRFLIGLLVAVPVAMGIGARFCGLGKWPLAMDEYYLARSIQNILHVGLPAYPCGGFYFRGVALQYTAALLQMAGASAELAPRLIAAVSSLAVLPAAYLLGRRLGGARIGLAAVAILAISVWEIEMARFGRMYAPFQAIFLWYLVFFLEFTLTGHRKALAPMLGLSVLGALVWEGGVFLAVINLLPPFVRNPSGHIERRDREYLMAVSLILGAAFWFDAIEHPGAGLEDLPRDYASPDFVSPSRLDAGMMPVSVLGRHPVWFAAALAPAAASVLAAIRIVSTFGGRPLASVALLACLASALLQQFGLAGAMLLGSLPLRIIDWRDLTARAARPFHVAIVTSLAYWIVFGLATRDWHEPGLSLPATVRLLAYELVRFPDVFRVAVVPLARAVPLMSLALLLVIAAAFVRVVRNAATAPAVERVLLAIFLLMLLAASASHPPRYETRYVFFLYPLAILIALRTIAVGTQRLLGAPHPTASAFILLSLLGFALTDDFQPGHLWNIDTAAVNFRLGMTEAQAQHYHPRTDVRAAAMWLGAHVDATRDVVVNAYPGVDFYYPASNFFFMEESDPRFEDVSCRRGTLERWSNRPLLRSVSMLAAQVSSGRKLWVVIDGTGVRALLSQLPPAHWQLEWSSRDNSIEIISLQKALPDDLKRVRNP